MQPTRPQPAQGDDEDAAADARSRRSALRVALAYALGAALWILGSDWLLVQLVSDPAWRVQVGALKGWFFVAVTAALLYLVLRRWRPRAARALAGEEPAPTLRGPLLAVAAGVLALTAMALHYDYQRHVVHHSQQLEAVAELRAEQVGQWLRERVARTSFVRSSTVWAELYTRWNDQGDQAAYQQLSQRMSELRHAFGDHSALLLDGSGQIVGGDLTPLPATPLRLREAAQRALASGQMAHTGLYSLPGEDRQAWLDVVAPLVATGNPARAAVVLRVDPTEALLPTLRNWPVPTRTGTTLLVRREGDALVGAFARNPRPLNSPDLLAARAVRGDVPLGRAAEGLDFRGTPVLGAVRQVPDTDWYLVAKIDRAEVRELALQSGSWIAATGALALLGVAIGSFLLRERRALELARVQQLAQGEQLRSLALVEAIAQASSDVIFAKDREGRYLLCNREAARVIGSSMEAIVGRDDVELFGAEQGQAFRDNDARVMEEGRLVSFEEMLTTVEGPRTFLATKGPLHDAQGRVAGTFGILRDITERKRAEAALAFSEATNRALLSAMADGMFVAQDHRFVFANPALPAMLGYAHEDFVGRPFAEVVAPESLALWTERFEQRVGEGPPPPAHYEVQFLHRNGRDRVWIELRARRFDFHGRPAVLGLVRDVSERRAQREELDRHRHRLQDMVEERTAEIRQAELQLQQANEALVQALDRAEAGSRAKSAFLANMSHEIRTPMNAIVGLTHLLRRDARQPVERERLRKVDEAARHLLQVIDDILDLSKIEAGKLELEVADFSLRAVLAQCRMLVADRVRGKALRLEFDADSVPDALRGDATRLLQALLNLLSNAVKFTEHGGIHLQVQLLARDDAGLLLRFAVRDTGIGIEPGQLGQLFSPFVQADASTTRRFGGTGLGLAITQRLAALMGGEVGASSQPGQGSEFWFTAQLQPGQAPVRAPSAKADAIDPELELRRGHAGARVLVVEDNAVNQAVAVDLLRTAGLQVDVSDDGEQALAQVQRTPYALVLMDVQMPVVDGLEATRRIRALAPAPAARVPILAMTANAFGDDRAACLAAGMDDHITKPVDPQLLYAALLRWLPPRHGEGRGDAATAAGPTTDAPAAASEGDMPAAIASPAAPAPMPAIDGIDPAQALHCAGGMVTLHWRLLRQFEQLYGGRSGEVVQQLAAGQADAARRLAHSIKGSSATIGASRLPALADALELALEQGRDDAPALAQAMADELARLLAAIGAALDAPGAPGGRAPRLARDATPAGAG